jgi:hypothetical protein
MQAMLSFEQAPPIAAPFRFFLTAPLFVVLAGVLLLVEGGELLSSRWTPGALALTHLVAIGFVLQVMLGALIQILPVVAGASLRHPLAVARVVHGLLVAGTLALAGGFLTQAPAAFLAAMPLLAGSLGIFLFCAARALFALPFSSPTIAGIRLALVGLLGLLGLGLALAGGLAGAWSVPLLELTHLHVNWAFAAWGLALLSAAAYVVVPMFQITPPYPRRFSAGFGGAVLASVGLVSLTVFLAGDLPTGLVQTVIVALAGAFCGVTLWLQSRSKRARPDATYRFWRLAMFSGLAACLLWSAARLVPAFGEWEGWSLAFGMLVLAGAFMSVIVGMLYKIVPFLVWLHLQNRGQGRVTAPNMKAVLAEALMLRHLKLHAAACLLLVAAVVWPVLTRPAGGLLVLAGALLGSNLLTGVRVYRRQARLIDARLAELGGGREGVA